MEVLTLVVAILFCCVHLFVKKFPKLTKNPRKPILTFASGASIAYITVHLLPDFQKVQKEFNHVLNIPKQFEPYSLYIIATVGFIAFYTINHFVRVVGEKLDKQERSYVFNAHIGAFVIYNAFIGYYLIKGLKQEPQSILIFGAIFILHLTVNDVGLRIEHKKRYDPFGSRILAVSLLAGWLLGFFTTLPTVVYAIWFSWLAGGILLNIIKEELPSARKGKLLPLILGAVISTVLFLFI
ncbi:hypothetical protein [Pseudalkalibacillus caeni]|uniref:Uncharacterized protein n=1 Tax=Exobacillus caeni TaxID=2574798 RepID=A0A5R9F0L6_9BACL|nr:hypothetical protein [Pseudalkalibacillus caeni]TLS36541.1 hypothetical protein FCL54_15130 [Pseudalkalibacillus caeni]